MTLASGHLQWDPVVETPAHLHPEIVALLRKRLSDLHNGFRQNVVLVGPPGSGKSSVLLAALSQPVLPDADGIGSAREPLIVYCAMHREGWEAWARRMVGATLLGLDGFSAARAGTYDVSQLLQRARATAPRTAQAAAELLAQIRATPHERVFRQLLDLPYLACDETKRPGVIVLDEFQELDELGIHRPFHELGKRIMLERSMLYLLASSQPLAARRILRERLNLLFGGFEHVDVHGVSDDVAQRFIRERLAHRHVPALLSGFLSWITGGHVWSLGTVLDSLHVRAGRGECSTEELLSFLAEELADTRRPLAVFCGERLHGLEEGRASRAYLGLLQAMAGHRATPRALAHATHQTVTETSRQLGRLFEHGLLERHGEVYTLESPLWSFWFRHVYLARRQALVTTVAGLTATVRAQLEREWRLFVAEQGVAPMQRFLGLLGSFHNELVRVESRRLRLPVFTELQRETLGPGAHQIMAHPHGGQPWLYFVKETGVDEADVTSFVHRSEQLPKRLGQRIMVSLDDCDAGVPLLAQVSRFWMWQRPTLAALYELYSLPALSQERA